MEAIKTADRSVANIKDGAYVPLINDDGVEDGEVLQVNGGRSGYGFHIYRMKPGMTTIAHTHRGDEEFYVIDGDIRDHDGYEYKPGDIVCLKSGTTHNSYSENGCTLVVLFRGEDEDS